MKMTHSSFRKLRGMVIGANALATVFLIAPIAAWASEGIVVRIESGCSYYVVETRAGYVILNWYGGKNPKEGDTLVGDLEGYGLKSIHNQTADQEMRVFVESSGLSEDDALERLNEECE